MNFKVTVMSDNETVLNHTARVPMIVFRKAVSSALQF